MFLQRISPKRADGGLLLLYFQLDAHSKEMFSSEASQGVKFSPNSLTARLPASPWYSYSFLYSFFGLGYTELARDKFGKENVAEFGEGTRLKQVSF